MNYTYRNDLNLWISSNDRRFTYSDGDQIEDKIYNIIKRAKNRKTTSDELRYYIDDWPTEYHLSPMRHNLLRPFFFDKESSILEIGSGCGAITRQLGESGARYVVAVEGSFRRAVITAERCRDLNNVHVYCENIQDFNIEFSFDIVTLIGVLEYARLFIRDEDPIHFLLKKANSYLKDDGLLLLAIENQLGLKYWNGASEDHTGRIFDGINDAYDEHSAVTFGKVELEKRLRKAGFSQIDFVYPFPDYKLPNLLIRQEALEDELFRAGPLIAQYKSRDYSGQENRLFKEERCWPLLERNGLVEHLSNSFLVIAGKGNRGIKDITDSWLAKTYTVSRKHQYWTENSFVKDRDKIVVKKTRLNNEKITDERIDQLTGTFPYLTGKHYTENLWNVTSHPNPYEEFIRYLEPWIHFLRQNTEKHTGNRWLPGHFIDCIPMNLIYDDEGNLSYFDIEWDLKQNIPMEWVVTRGIINHLNSMSDCDRKLIMANKRPIELLQDVGKHFNLALDEEAILRILEREADFHEIIFLKSKHVFLDEATRWLYKEIKKNTDIVHLIDSRTGHVVTFENKPTIIQLYYSDDHRFVEERSLFKIVKMNGDLEIFEFDLPNGSKFIRIDPINTVSFLEINYIEISIHSDESEKVILKCSADDDYASLSQIYGMIRMKGSNGFLSLHDDPHLFLQIAEEFYGFSLRVRIEMAAHKYYSEKFTKWFELGWNEMQQSVIMLSDSLNDANGKLNLKQKQWDELVIKYGCLEEKYKLLEENWNDAKKELYRKENENIMLSQNLGQLHQEFLKQKMLLENTQAQLSELQNQLEEILQSMSWRLTRPIRRLAEIFKNIKRRERR